MYNHFLSLSDYIIHQTRRAYLFNKALFLTCVMIIATLLFHCESEKSNSEIHANELYQTGMDFASKYSYSLDKNEWLKAKQYFMQAIDLDEQLAPAYIGLGWVYFDSFYWWSEEFLKRDYLDSVLILTNKALVLDSTLAEAYHLKGKYYGHTGNPERAIENINQSIQIQPNEVSAYLSLGWIYCQLKQDYIAGFKYYHKAMEMDDGKEWTPRSHNDMAYGYMNIGDYDKALYHLHKAIRLQPDVMEPILLSSWLLEVQGKIDEKLLFIDSIHQVFPGSNACISELAYTYAGLGEFEKAEQYYAQVIDTLNQEDRIPLKFAHRLGYVFWNLGQKSRAMEYFESQLAYCEESLAGGKGYQTVEYDLAAVHAFLDHEKEALDYLEQYAAKGFTYGLHDYIERDPLFDKIRGNDIFRQIVDKAQKEKVRLRTEINEIFY